MKTGCISIWGKKKSLKSISYFIIITNYVQDHVDCDTATFFVHPGHCRGQHASTTFTHLRI